MREIKSHAALNVITICSIAQKAARDVHEADAAHAHIHHEEKFIPPPGRFFERQNLNNLFKYDGNALEGEHGRPKKEGQRAIIPD